MPGAKKLKRIEAHTDEELDAAVKAAADKFGDDFWIVLHGIDAYLYRRKRRDVVRHQRMIEACQEPADPWGNS
jgi:hypothetical protein